MDGVGVEVIVADVGGGVVVGGGSDGVSSRYSGGLHRGALLLFGVQTKVQGCSMIGKSGSMFSGRHSSSLADCTAYVRQLLWLALVSFKLGPHNMQWASLGEGQVVVGCSFVQVMQHLSLRHLSLTCPYSWYLLHLIGSKMSLLAVTCKFKMNTHSVSSLFAAVAEAQVTLMLANFWLGALSSGFLIHEAVVME